MKFRVVVANAMNRIGGEIINQLQIMKFPYGEVIALGKTAESGQKISFGEDETLVIKSIASHDFLPEDINFFPYTEHKVMEDYKDKAIKSGGIVLDLSHESGLNKSIPSLIPSVNDHEFLMNHSQARLISIPLSISTQLALMLKPLDMEYDIKRVVISTYQAVSNNGDKEALDELYNQTKEIFTNQEVEARYFPEKIAFNIIPSVGEIYNNVSQEESRIIADLRKLVKKDLNIAINTAYVPVFVGNSAYINIEFNREFEIEDVNKLLREVEELNLIDEEDVEYVTPSDIVGEEFVIISRVKRDSSAKSAISMWSCCDNLRRGSAITAVEMAKFLAENVIKE